MNLNHRIRVVFYRLIYLRKCKKHHVQIPPNTCGKGLCFEHFYGIVINPKAKIGDNCNVHQFVTIGNNGKIDIAPTIGDSCYIGAGAILVGDIHVGKKAVIGAGSVVIRNVEDFETVVGVPAHPISKKQV